MTLKSVFRNQCQDEGGEQILSVDSRDTSIVVSSLKTFSCESETEPMETFNSHRYFAFDNSEEETIQTRLQYRQTIDPRQQQQDCVHFEHPIVTPQRPCAGVVEISLDPLPETQTSPLLLGIGSDDQNRTAENEIGLLFPLIDSDCPTTTNLVSNVSSLPENSEERYHNVRSVNDDLAMCNLYDTYVHKQLRSSLPLPKSFRPILCLLLHMEFSSTIHGKVLKQACETFNEQWKGATCGLYSIRVDSERDVQNVSGKIVDNFVETLGPLVDFPALFQASAQTYSNLATATENDRLSIFFQTQTDARESKETESQDLEDVAIHLCASNKSTGRECTSGRKRKTRTSDDEDDDDEKLSSQKREEFVPTVLQLAIAYGARHSALEDGLPEYGQMRLEEFTKKMSNRFQCMGPIERRNEWNDLIEVWQNQRNTS